MKVLVTGAGGFIGSYLSERLVKLGYEVKALVRYNSRNYWGWLENSPVRGEIEIVSGDIRSFDSVRVAVEGVKMVFHLAALIGIPYSYHSPDSYVDTNIKGTLNVLQAAKEFGVQKVIHTSTSEVYGTAKFIPITEEHPINPQSPYAATKSAADLLALSFCNSFDLPVTIVRPFNTYGPRQSGRAIIPTIITQIQSGKKEIEVGSLSPTRDFTYVKDTVEGFIKAAKSSNSINEIINLGSSFEISVKDLIKLLSEIMKRRIKIVSSDRRKRPPQSEVQRLMADTSKAKKLLSWLPRYKLEQGLKETVEWFKSQKESFYKSNIYNV